MQSLVLVALSAALLAPTVGAQSSKFRSEAYGFACDFPSKVNQSKTRTRDGLALTTFNSIVVGKWGAVVSTAFADPRETSNPRRFYADLLSGKMQSFSPRNLETTQFLAQPALKFDVTVDGTDGRGIVVLDEEENRVFVLVGLTMTDDGHPLIQSFFDSFEILSKSAYAEPTPDLRGAQATPVPVPPVPAASVLPAPAESPTRAIKQTPAGKSSAQVSGTAQVVRSGEAWLDLMDSGKYQESWSEASELFHSQFTAEKWVELANAIRRPMGARKSRMLKRVDFSRVLPAVPAGNYAVIEFDASFANKTKAAERLILMEVDGRWLAAGYYIN